MSSALRVLAVTSASIAALAAGAAPRPIEVHIAFSNVNLRVADGVVLEVHHMDGSLIGKQPGRAPLFDDQKSFSLHIDSGELAMSPASLTTLLNRYTLAYEGSPLRNVEVSIEKGRVKQKGTLKKGLSIPFTVVADISATADGQIRLHPTEVKAAGLPSGGFMKMIGLELDDLIKSKQSRGIRVIDNDFILDPTSLLPEPAMSGRLTAVSVDGDRIVQRFGKGTRGALAAAADRRAKNYMYYRGGSLRFGKLTMSDTDMQLIDADDRDPFDFSPPQYVKQLVAGYSKNTASGGLRVYMPDFDQAAGTDLRPTR